MCFSNLTREDFEVYLRSKIFDNKIQRDLWKFYYECKWAHYKYRKEIIKNFNLKMNRIREEN